MKLSIVTTLYHSAPYLPEFYHRISTTAQSITDDFELVFVNDGSPDASLEITLGFYTNDPHVRIIDLSRNFGHHKAMMTGLAYATGDLVFLIDCDLEVAPEYLTEFYQHFTSSKVDVVFGVQQKRQDPLLDRMAGEMFYILFNWFSPVHLPPNLTTTRLMSRRYVSALVQHREREILIGGLWQLTGFSQLPIPIAKRPKGVSAYNLQRKLAIIIEGITSFSNRPLEFVFYFGCLIVVASGLAAFYLIIRWLFIGPYLDGWPSLMVSIWLLGGLTIFCIGVIGIYISKIFTEVKQRPYTIIRQIHEPETKR